MLDHKGVPRFQLSFAHQLAAQDLRERMNRGAAQIEAQYGVTCTWEADDRLLVSRKGLKAQVSLAAEAVRVDIELGLLLTPGAASIRTGIEKQLSELLVRE